MSDIDISIRINEYSKLRSNDICVEELKYIIESALEERTKKIKGISINVTIVDEDSQEAIDIGKSILALINKRVEEEISQLSISGSG